MGGVDLADMLIALYRSHYKSKRWYMGIFSQLVDICMNNGWLLYRKQMDAMGQPKHDKLKKFKTEKTSKSDFTNDQPFKKVSLAARPSDDDVGHFPIFVEKGRCNLSTNGQTTIFVKNVNCVFVLSQETIL
ncbi:hypothetical protein HHI36_010413 [Cryptolaemus montrouzieri]|uniref:PiggyBac transposable element-derived protein domain-containing protein n=1 Tax=Cryptolaemus montrouzieri TaxID=559131 RepID=A0ABD2MJ44_9CUCU